MDLQEIKEDPMGDDDIKYYFPKARTITYADLSKYKTIDEVLPKNQSYIFLLYQASQNNGHWTLVYNNNGEINFFCPYGSTPSIPLHWTPLEKRRELGEAKPYLDYLLSSTNKKVIYNPIDYQNKKNDEISTCGRHCCNILASFLKGINMSQYYKGMRDIKNKTGKNYDDIVSMLFNKS
jgi:hypothetical protein